MEVFKTAAVVTVSLLPSSSSSSFRGVLDSLLAFSFPFFLSSNLGGESEGFQVIEVDCRELCHVCNMTEVRRVACMTTQMTVGITIEETKLDVIAS